MPEPKPEPPPDHRAALARIDPVRMAEMSRLADAPGLLRLAAHVTLVAALALAVAAAEGWLRLAAQAGLGAALIFLFCLAHEAIHRTAFASPALNDAAAWGAGLVIGLPPHGFRYFHLAHHRHTQDPERDPELASPKPATWPGYLWRLTGWHYWSGQARALAGAASGAPLPDWVPPRGAAKVRAEARVFLALYGAVLAASLATGSLIAWDFWLLPLLLGQPLLRAFLMAEHTACPQVADMLANTRTTFAHRAVRWLTWEMPFHTAHHAAPLVPFHRLAALTAALEPHLASRAEGYPDAHRQITGSLRAGPRPGPRPGLR